MSELKVYAARDCENIMSFAKTHTRNEARARLCSEIDEDYIHTKVERIPWLDRFDYLQGPDAEMAMARHGWQIDSMDLHSAGLDGEENYQDDLFTPMELFGGDESKWERYAKAIGAAYPDYYKPKEAVK